MKNKIWIGIDIGSVSVKLAIFIKANSAQIKFPAFFQQVDLSQYAHLSGTWFISEYQRHNGEPLVAAEKIYKEYLLSIDNCEIVGICATGAGGKSFSNSFNTHYINEIKASAEGIATFNPDVKTIFELGGERSKYVQIEARPSASPVIISYDVNGECAAGTGTFFDQQAARLHYKIDEVSTVLQNIDRAANIAGRCSVFAKSDMIHAQQRGYKPAEVLKGLCNAVVRNFKGNVTKGKTIVPKVALIGGMALNKGIADAVLDAFDLNETDLIVSELSVWLGCIGAALYCSRLDNNGNSDLDKMRTVIDDYIPVTNPLSMENVTLLREKVKKYCWPEMGIVDAWLGIDIGSVSSNLALIDADGQLIHGIYTMTNGRPVEVVEKALREMGALLNERVKIRGVGTTGSGRELIGALTGADVIKDEITAHKTGALHISHKYLNLEVDTIFEIGGQDSKFISLEDEVVVDFTLNDACAAGTGSFLEEQAGELDIAIKEEFSRLALQSKAPLKLGERCTVFMEKELIPYLHKGVPKPDIVAGLALSVVNNYLNRVVKKRKIGDVIFFQGGTAFNNSVAAAFATILNKPIIVPPHNGIMGAIGAALLAQKSRSSHSTFKGWDLTRVPRKMREFICKGCSNNCLMQEFTVDGEKSYWGDKCSEKYRKFQKTTIKPSGIDLFAHHDKVIFESGYTPSKPNRGEIVIPRVLSFYDRLPFWRSYFEELGMAVKITGPSRRIHVEKGIETAVADQCFPVQMAHGHVWEIAEADPENIFIPNIVNEIDPTNSIGSFICPWTQTLPLVIRHTKAFNSLRDKLFFPNVQFRRGIEFVTEQLFRELPGKWKIRRKENKNAVQTAWKIQNLVNQQIQDTGEQVLDKILTSNKPVILLLGRPYNLYDSGLNLNIPGKLQKTYGVDVIPLDYLPLDTIDISEIHDHMFWNYGRRILQAAKFSAQYSSMHIIYLSNFKCGPDSYIRHYVQDASGQPFLFLQLDGHANDAGVMTRIEAFLESKRI